MAMITYEEVAGHPNDADRQATATATTSNTYTVPGLPPGGVL